jgi:hypothetical protein
MMFQVYKVWKTLLIICFSMLLTVNKARAQSDVLSRYIEEVVEEDADTEVDLEQLTERLDDLREHPLNLNTVTREELEEVPLLPASLIENILYYRDRYQGFHSLPELLLVRDMNAPVYNLLTEVFIVKPIEKKEYTPTLKQLFQQGTHELSTRLDVPFYRREGYRSHSSEVLEKNPNKQYLGNALYHNVRYRFHYGRRLEIGLTAEKDAGEPFFNRINRKGYDFYSPYVIIRNFHKLSVLAFGNYRVNYGYGLVMNSGFNMGKAAMISTLDAQNEGITKHSSTNEYRYFQGVATGIRWTNRLNTDFFFSYRTMDATPDSLWITALKTDGYHRLQREVEKKNQVANTLIGSNIRYRGKYFRVGITGVYHVFNKLLKPELTGYRFFQMNGKEFWNVGANYKLFLPHHLTLYGETALDHQGAIATLNVLTYSPSLNHRFVVMNRFYDVRYQSLYAQAVSESSGVQGESALYIGLENKVMRYVRLNGFVDIFYFPWKKYRLSKAGTKGVDTQLQLTYQPGNELEMWIKYRFRRKYRDLTENASTLTLPYIQHKAYYTLQWSPNTVWKYRWKVNYGQVHYQNRTASHGGLLSTEVGYHPEFKPFQADLSLTVFRTDDYDSRQSVYEKSVLYAFSSASFYGEGLRMACVLRWDVNSHWTLQGKLGETHYFDRRTIGTGLDLIDGRDKADLNILVRMKY